MLHITHYIADTSSIINLQAANQLRLLTQLSVAGHFKVPARVIDELTGPGSEGKDPELARWVKKYQKDIEIPDAQIPDDVFAEIIRKYRVLTRGRRGLSAADPQFVAALKYCSQANPGLVGLSDDAGVCRACQEEGLPCIGWQEFIHRETGRPSWKAQ